jgi:GTP-binding protein
MSRARIRKTELPPELDESWPLVAIAGRPNVGKSTLYNRLVGGNPAIVDATAGVTRDRRYGVVDWGRAHFRLVDTGGLDPGARGGVIQQGIHRQADVAIQQADLVLFVIDALEGVTAVDREIAKRLRQAGRPTMWVANKCDSARQESLAAEMYELGADEVLAISGAHGRGIGELLDRIVARLPGSQREDEAREEDAEAEAPEVDEDPDRPVRLAFLGKPNVGKSSLVNRLLGEERVLVHDQPGTTVDPIDTHVRIGEREFTLVDTAGIRRRRSIDRKDTIEVVSVSMAIATAERADVVALVMDAREGVTEQDQKIAGIVEKAGRGIVIVFNKLDLLGAGAAREAARKKLLLDVEDKLPFVEHAPILFVSAQSGEHVSDLAETAAKVFGEYSRRIPTSELNRFFADVQSKKQPPSAKGNPVKIHYITQSEIRPPLFVLSVNRPEWVHFTYRRFLQNQIRETFGFAGSPVRLVCREKAGRHRHGTRRER